MRKKHAMKKNSPHPTVARIFLLTIALVASGCNKDNETGQAPQIASKDKVGCLATNDFYAVHFSAYLQPSVELKNVDRAALLKPFCKELPGAGKVFFSADLIDDDIRETPIGIRVVEVNNNAKTGNSTEIRTLTEVPAKTYPKGVVEAQATVDKDGDYAMILLVGGDNAKSEDDKLTIPFHVGGDPYNPYGWPHETWLAIVSGIGFAVLSSIYLLYRLLKRKK
jgi:hypothetical protein